MQSATTTRPTSRPGSSAPPPPPAQRNGGSVSGQAPARQRGPLLVVYPEDGLLTILLVGAVVYLTIASIVAVTPPWAPGMQILIPITLIGLFVGLLAVQQRFLPGPVVHTVATILGCLIAFLLTARAVLDGNNRLLLRHLGVWLDLVRRNQASNDNTIFLLFLAALSYLLAYLSMWLVVHLRRPWLAVIANGVVLIINLNFASADELVFLLLFLLAALLLLVRFTLMENLRRWRADRLRFSPDLSWDFQQLGAFFCVIVLILAYVLPAGAPNSAASAFWNDPNGPWVGLQHRFQVLFGNLNGPGGGGLGFFGANLHLQANVDLSSTEVLRYVSGDPDQYLITQTYDTYDGQANWSQSLTQTHSYPAGAVFPPLSPVTRLSGMTVDLTNIGNGQRNLFGAGEPASYSVPTDVSVTSPGSIPTAWYAQRDLVSGQTYSAESYLSTASIDQLRAVSDPAHAPQSPYPAEVLADYLNNTNTTISPEVAATAKVWAGSAPTPYDAAEAIEAQLRTFHFSFHNGTIPANEDAVVWFLHNKSGFCTFFASAMALMMRSLGMPARIAEGFTNGEFEPTQRNFVVIGKDAHVWTQVYFSGYGWINFEPTQSFNVFQRGSTSGTPSPGITPTGQGGGGNRLTPTTRIKQETPGPGGPGSTPPAVSTLREVGIALAFLIAFALLVIGGFLAWWRALYRRLSPVGGAFARVSRLGAWSGSPPSRDQTPYEYADQLGHVVPSERATLRRLTDLYVQDRWGGVSAPAAETASLYLRVRAALTQTIVHRWREIPAWLMNGLRSIAERLRPRQRRGNDLEQQDAEQYT
jgi:transglutaminase-like putative cysteine protease